MEKSGLGGRNFGTTFRRVDLDTSGANITLNSRLNSVFFVPSDNIGAAKTWVVNSNNSSFEFRGRFTLTTLDPHTWPANFKSTDPLWDAATNIWTPLDLGEYEYHATYDGTNWNLSIVGLLT